MKKTSTLLAAGILGSVFLCTPVFADEIYCEVLAVEGDVTLTSGSAAAVPVEEGDLLAAEDQLNVGKDSYVDLAYDRDLYNVSRIEENTSIKIRSLDPISIGLDSGGVYAKLKALPSDSSFEVRTPTAIASVRGSEYRTTYWDSETEVENVSTSEVFLYGFDERGLKIPEPTVVQNAFSARVGRHGGRPQSPKRMEPAHFKKIAEHGQKIEKITQENFDRGRKGKMRGTGVGKHFIEQRQQMKERKAGGVKKDPDAANGNGDANSNGRPGQPETVSGEQAREKASGVFRSGGDSAGQEGGAGRLMSRERGDAPQEKASTGGGKPNPEAMQQRREEIKAQNQPPNQQQNQQQKRPEAQKTKARPAAARPRPQS